jgi:hypothetical protein
MGLRIGVAPTIERKARSNSTMNPSSGLCFSLTSEPMATSYTLIDLFELISLSITKLIAQNQTAVNGRRLHLLSLLQRWL